jgi:hypothetical protein
LIFLLLFLSRKKVNKDVSRRKNMDIATAKRFVLTTLLLYFLSLLVQRKEQTRPNVPFSTGGESTADFDAEAVLS